jgi:hypothetical protein
MHQEKCWGNNHDWYRTDIVRGTAVVTVSQECSNGNLMHF